jgi:hypothetical protein
VAPDLETVARFQGRWWLLTSRQLPDFKDAGGSWPRDSCQISRMLVAPDLETVARFQGRWWLLTSRQLPDFKDAGGSWPQTDLLKPFDRLSRHLIHIRLPAAIVLRSAQDRQQALLVPLYFSRCFLDNQISSYNVGSTGMLGRWCWLALWGCVLSIPWHFPWMPQDKQTPSPQLIKVLFC